MNTTNEIMSLVCIRKYDNPSESDCNCFSLGPCGTVFIFTCHQILGSMSMGQLLLGHVLLGMLMGAFFASYSL